MIFTQAYSNQYIRLRLVAIRNTMKDLKIEVAKHTVNAKSRKLTATWCVEDFLESGPAVIKPVSEMTELEKEVEVIRRLTEPPKKESLADVIADQLAAEITLEIDKEILNSISMFIDKNR